MESLSNLKILDKLFDNTTAPYTCETSRTNPELMKLLYTTYQDSYEEVKCKTCTCNLTVYQRTVGDYDDWDIETICFNDWIKLPHRPTKLIETLKKEKESAKEKEKKAGIIHYSRRSDWVGADLSHSVPIPHLKLKELN